MRVPKWKPHKINNNNNQSSSSSPHEYLDNMNQPIEEHESDNDSLGDDVALLFEPPKPPLPSKPLWSAAKKAAASRQVAIIEEEEEEEEEEESSQEEKEEPPPKLVMSL